MNLVPISRRKGLIRGAVCWILAFVVPLQCWPAGQDASTLPTSVAHFKYPPFLIGPGDLLTVTVFGEKDLPTSFLVDSSGTIVFPPIGAIDLGGLTQVEASRVLAAALGRYMKDPQVTVLVTDSAQYTVSVMGNVVKPGRFAIRGMPTLLTALSEAGGPLPDSALNSTILVRDNINYELPLGRLLEMGHGSQPQTVLFPGDVIYVPASHWPTLSEWGVIVTILTSVVLVLATVRTLQQPVN